MIKEDTTELLELLATQRLGHDVRDVVVGRDELGTHDELLDELPNLEVTTLNVLGARVGDVVPGQGNRTLVIDASVSLSVAVVVSVCP